MLNNDNDNWKLVTTQNPNARNINKIVVSEY